ncbi:MAG: ASKHA domain-containing protein [Lachnospiraceae bacterium]
MDAHIADNLRMNMENAIGVAVDLGSTTIAVCCMDMTTKKEILSFSFANPQSRYGADVITRIRYCMESNQHLLELGQMVREELKAKLEEHLGDKAASVSQIVYSGNTTMLHFLRGLSVDGLASAPFTPVTIDYAKELISNENTLEAVYPPGFSAFVGADILTGAEYLQMGRDEQYDLLVDLGTNGEMLLLNQTHGYAVSTACGPVFDSAITGAVYGSECIRAIASCVKCRLISEEGLIVSPYFEKGIEIDKGFVIKQQHVRNFQLAKGAIYAGIRCLMEKAGINADKIGHVYISGGLGFYMDTRDAFTVKMLPEEFAGKISVSGNSSLEGAKKLLLADDKEMQQILEDYEAIRKRTESLELANLQSFQDIFIQSLNF